MFERVLNTSLKTIVPKTFKVKQFLQTNFLRAMGQLGFQKIIKKNTFMRVFVCRGETLERIFRLLKSFVFCFP